MLDDKKTQPKTAEEIAQIRYQLEVDELCFSDMAIDPVPRYRKRPMS